MISKSCLIAALVSISLSANAQNVETSVKESPDNPAVATAPTEFVKKIDLTGDFRYRYQATQLGSAEERRVNRILFRVGQSIQLQNDLKVTYRLLTGTSAVAGNLTLGDSKAPGAARQAFGLDLAYGTYMPMTDMNLYFGKMPQFTYFPGKNQVIFDRDLSPEGLGAQYKLNLLDDQLMTTFNLGGFWIREKYDDVSGKDLNDSYLSMAQINLNYKLDAFSFLIGTGLFNYSDIKGDKPASFATGLTTSKGNTLTAGSAYENNYEITQNYAEIKWSEKPFDVSIFAELDNNTAANDLGRASTYGMAFGWNRLSISCMYEKIEKDAVLAVFTDSDFAEGNTSADGYIANVTYKLTKNAAVAVTHYINQRGIDLAKATDYRSTYADVTLSF